MENQKTKDLLMESVYKLVCALAKLLLRYGISSQEFFEVSKKAFVDVARADFGIRGRPTNKSRIATLTGLSRKEVARLLEAAGHHGLNGSSPNRAMRVVSAWLREPAYVANGSPMDIPIAGECPSFEALVKQYSGDIPPTAMLRDLVRLRIVEQRGEGVGLLQHGFIPSGDDTELLPVLGTDVAALIETISQNLQATTDERLFQRKAAFANVSPEGFEALQALAKDKGQQFLEEVDALLAEYHSDVDQGHRDGFLTGLGMYVFVDKAMPDRR